MKISSNMPSSPVLVESITTNASQVEKSQQKNQAEEENILDKLTEEKQKELTKEEAEQIVNGINQFLQPKFTSLQFKMHDNSDRYYVEVVDQETKKILKEIPDKKLLDIYAKMTDFLGLIIDKKL